MLGSSRIRRDAAAQPPSLTGDAQNPGQRRKVGDTRVRGPTLNAVFGLTSGDHRARQSGGFVFCSSLAAALEGPSPRRERPGKDACCDCVPVHHLTVLPARGGRRCCGGHAGGVLRQTRNWEPPGPSKRRTPRLPFCKLPPPTPTPGGELREVPRGAEPRAGPRCIPGTSPGDPVIGCLPELPCAAGSRTEAINYENSQ